TRLVLDLAIRVEVTRSIFQAVVRTVVDRKEGKTEAAAKNKIVLEGGCESEARRDVAIGGLDSRRSASLLRTGDGRSDDYASRLIVIRYAIAAFNEGRENVVPHAEIQGEPTLCAPVVLDIGRGFPELVTAFP